MFLFYLKYPRFLFRWGQFIPFVVHNKTYIKVKKNACLKLSGRLHIGNKNLPVLSRVPTNIYIDQNATLSLEKGISVGPGVNLIVKKNGTLVIGENSYFTSDSHIEAVEKIDIGKDCAISWGVTIIDSDHHQIITSELQNRASTSPVKIGDHCWIGCNVTILKGSVIGNNCIVAAGSVVSGIFPDNSLIAGVPGKVVKKEIGWK